MKLNKFSFSLTIAFDGGILLVINYWKFVFRRLNYGR